jgi:hypothetical protein
MIPDGCTVTSSRPTIHLLNAGYDRRHAAARVHTITGALSASGDDLRLQPEIDGGEVPHRFLGAAADRVHTHVTIDALYL